MSNFIELTNHDDGDLALINLDSIEFITCAREGGTVLVSCNGRGARGDDRFYHVRESYNLVKQKIFAKNETHKKWVIEDLREYICDNLCRFPRECNQDELDAKCENCPMCEVLDS